MIDTPQPYISFTKNNPHADGKNGPKQSLIHGHLSNETTEHHQRTGRRIAIITKCGPIPGLDDELTEIFRLNRKPFETDEECLIECRRIAENLGWQFSTQ